MSNFDSIDEALNVESNIVGVEKPAPLTKPEEKNDISKDYEYKRANLDSLIEKGQEAINGTLDLAMSSDHPRAYEVAGQLIKHVGDVADKLMALQKEPSLSRRQAKRSN